MDNIDKVKLREDRYEWERANAPDALKGLEPEELHEHMRDAYCRHVRNDMHRLFSGLCRKEEVRV